MELSELNALPDVTPRFSTAVRVIYGRTFTVPVECGFEGALFQAPDDGVFEDANGVRWVTGWRGGEHVRRLAPPGEPIAEGDNGLGPCGSVGPEFDAERAIDDVTDWITHHLPCAEWENAAHRLAFKLLKDSFVDHGAGCPLCGS